MIHESSSVELDRNGIEEDNDNEQQMQMANTRGITN
jgi:hypothetical protein